MMLLLCLLYFCSKWGHLYKDINSELRGRTGRCWNVWWYSFPSWALGNPAIVIHISRMLNISWAMPGYPRGENQDYFAHHECHITRGFNMYGGVRGNHLMGNKILQNMISKPKRWGWHDVWGQPLLSNSTGTQGNILFTPCFVYSSVKMRLPTLPSLPFLSYSTLLYVYSWIFGR